jgi:hypothetical protein
VTDARAPLAAVGAFFAALVASGHHTIHMALISLGVGAGGFTHLLDADLRRAMIVVSLAMTAASAWWFLRRKHRRGAAEIVAVVAASAAAVALVLVSVVRDGW